MKISMTSMLKRVSSRHFKTSFWMLLCLTHVFLGLGLLLWYHSFYKMATEKVEFRLTAVMSQVEQTLGSAVDNALFAGTLPSVNRSFLSKEPSVDRLYEMSKDLEPFVNQMTYDSLTLYFQDSSFVYDTKAGIYSAETFYNPELLRRFKARSTDAYWEIGYPYRFYYDGSEHHVLTYVRSLPVYGTGDYGFLAVNLPVSTIYHALGKYEAEFGEQMIVRFHEKNLWQPKNKEGERNPQREKDLQAKPLLSISGGLFPELSGEVYLPKYLFLKHSFGYFPMLLSAYLFLMMLNFLTALAYACYHLNKIDLFLQKIGMSGFRSISGQEKKSEKNLLQKVTKPMKSFSFQGNFEKEADEFQLLNEAADHLQEQINNIRQSVAESKPLLQERLLTDILYHHVDVDKIPPEYEEYDISFPYPYFCIVLMAIQEIESVPTTTIKEEIKLVAKQNAMQLFSTLGRVYSIYSEKENLLFLINTEEKEQLKETIQSIAIALKKGMRESLGFHLLFSVAFCDDENPVPYYAWTKARKNLIFTSGSSDSFIIFSRQENYATALMPSVIYQITQAVVDKDTRRLEEIAEHFYRHNLPEDMPIAKARKTLLLAAASVFSALLEIDVLFPMEEMNQMVRKIEQSDNLHQSKELFRNFLLGLVHTENKVSIEAQEYIRQTIAYLEKHFAEPITIPQIAENVGISPIYLNKLFKLSTGKTLSEYLNFYRTEKSKSMLLETDMTINDISKALGYNDVRSYIRFFKKFYEVTPNGFRKSGE